MGGKDGGWVVARGAANGGAGDGSRIVVGNRTMKNIAKCRCSNHSLRAIVPGDGQHWPDEVARSNAKRQPTSAQPLSPVRRLLHQSQDTISLAKRGGCHTTTVGPVRPHPVEPWLNYSIPCRPPISNLQLMIIHQWFPSSLDRAEHIDLCKSSLSLRPAMGRV